MTRNTHNRLYDHHGLDSLSNLELTEFLGPYSPGRTVVDVLSDLLSRVVALEAFNGIFPFTVSAIVLDIQSGTFSLSAIAFETQSGTFGASAVAFKTQSGTFGVSSIALSTIPGSFGISASISS